MPKDPRVDAYIAKANDFAKPILRQIRSAVHKGHAAVPTYLRAALRTNAKARASFDAFSPSHKREYVEWIDSAKTDETRQRRITTALQWIASGKSRNWKYERR